MIQCGYRLEDTGRTVTVPGACCGHEVQAVHRCGVNGECIDVGSMPGLTACNLCTVSNRPPTFPVVKPASYAAIRFPSQASKDGAFNCSIHGDEKAGFAFAFRSGWTSSNIRLCRLSDDGRSIGTMLPAFLLHERAARGREDPRLFRFQGRWHFSFTGYERGRFFSSVLVAEIDQWPTVSRVWYPQYDQRHPEAEKNWGFFEHAGRLHAVYRIGPGEHRVLEFHGREVCNVHSSNWEPGWQWGVMRGGASPVLHNGEWYSWFHGFKIGAAAVTYTCGLYTFENKPPFRPLRVIKSPVVMPGLSHMSDDGWRKSIYYPCGAALKNGRWWVSAGEHDNRCTLASFDANEIEASLSPVKSGPISNPEMGEILSLNGWCSETKANRIADMVAAIPEKVNGVEIGVFAGRSLFAAALGCRANPNGGHIVGVDSYDAEENLRGVDTEEHRRHWPQHLVDEAKAACAETRAKLRLEDFCRVVVGKSCDHYRDFAQINYLHIDGNHSAEGATIDAELYLPKVVSGGLVVVDDTHPNGKPDFLDGVQACVAIVERQCDLLEDHGTWRVYRKR